jgi:hypothetical protein
MVMTLGEKIWVVGRRGDFPTGGRVRTDDGRRGKEIYFKATYLVCYLLTNRPSSFVLQQKLASRKSSS